MVAPEPRPAPTLNGYRQSITQQAAARREDLAAKVSAYVAAAETHPVRRADLGEVLGVPPRSSAVGDAIKLAMKRGELFSASSRSVTTPTGTPRACWGLYPDEATFDRAREAALAAT